MGAGGIFLVILLLAVSIGLGILLVRQWFEKRQLSDELFKAQTALNDRTNKLEALSEAFTTRKMVEGNLGEKLRDLTQYIEEVQTAYATELDANTALVNSVKAELNAPKSEPLKLSEDNEADKFAADTEETSSKTETSGTGTAEAEIAEAKPSEPRELDASESEATTKNDTGAAKAANEAPSAPFRLEAKAPTDTHIDKTTN